MVKILPHNQTIRSPLEYNFVRFPYTGKYQLLMNHLLRRILHRNIKYHLLARKQSNVNLYFPSSGLPVLFLPDLEEEHPLLQNDTPDIQIYSHPIVPARLRIPAQTLILVPLFVPPPFLQTILPLLILLVRKHSQYQIKTSDIHLRHLPDLVLPVPGKSYSCLPHTDVLPSKAVISSHKFHSLIQNPMAALPVHRPSPVTISAIAPNHSA